MLGRPFREVFPEFYEELSDRVVAARRGQRIYVRDGLLLMDRERPEADQLHWGLEETYHVRLSKALYARQLTCCTELVICLSLPPRITQSLIWL